MAESPSGLALITGASAGLGTAYAHLFAAKGHAVVLVARREDRLKELAVELQDKHGVDAYVVAADLAKLDGPTQVFEAVRALDVPLRFLVNNAGFGTLGAFVESPLARELGQVQVNVLALVHLTHLFLPEMIARKQGAVLNVGSIAGFQPGPFMATYFATKAFVNSFTSALDFELRGTGVTATAQCPGPTVTEFGELSGNGESRAFKVRRPATAQDVARHGYRAMQRGDSVAVHGFFNRLLIALQRFAPRKLVRRIAARMNMT